MIEMTSELDENKVQTSQICHYIINFIVAG